MTGRSAGSSFDCQLRHKADTDAKLLNEAWVVNLADSDFFIRKAIGWALRAFVADHRDELSTLSYREATKHL